MHNQAGGRALCACALLVSVLTVATGGAPPAGAAVRDVSQFACAPGLTTPFTDVAGTTHAASIACAVHYQLTGGTSPTTYAPDGVVSRGQMATFIVNLLWEGGNVEPSADAPTFADTAGSPHEDSIRVVAEYGIAQGTSPTTFSPSAPVSRAQMATFLLNTLAVVGYEPAGIAADAFPDDDGSPHEAAIDEVTSLGIAAGTGPLQYSPAGTVSRGAMASFLVRTLDYGIEHWLLSPIGVAAGWAALDGASEVPGPGDPDGRASAAIVVTDVPGVVCFYLNLDVAGIDAPTAAHVHIGGTGSTGDPVVTLPTPALGQQSGGCVHDSDAAGIAANLEGFYVNIHTAAYPDGALRGQLGTATSDFWTELRPNDVVPGPGESDAAGAAYGWTTTKSVVCVSAIALVGGTITGAHIHEAPLHQNGPEVASYAPDTVDPAGAMLECVSSAQAAAIGGNPAAFAFDVHTAAYPDGALRGQFTAIEEPVRGPSPMVGTAGATRTWRGARSA